MRLASLSVLVCLFAPSQAHVRASAEPVPPHYSIDARLDPAHGTLEADVVLTGLDRLPEGAVLYLHRSARIREVQIDGVAAPVRVDVAGAAGPYMPQGVPLQLPPGRHRTLHLRYEVTLEGMVNDVNTISPSLVELALYASWYPVSPQLPRFTYDLAAALPPGWTAVANAERSKDDESAFRWRTGTPVNDIVVLASPDLRVRGTSRDGASIDVMAPASTIDRLAPVLDEMHAAMTLGTSWFGAPGGAGRLCLVFPPRAGWGYSRPPLIVTNRAYAEALVADKDGMPARLKGAYHEMAHFWWAVARPESTDDWINEGLAEFTAWRLLRERAGAAAAATSEATFRKDALGEGVNVAVTASRDEPARYVNRYEKGALVFIGLERRFGWDRLQACLRRVLSEARTTPMTTGRLLEIAEATIGSAAAAYIGELIDARGWTPALLESVPAARD